ncbi:MAG: DUF6285 domain-containing protein [Myxococcota bacterium]
MQHRPDKSTLLRAVAGFLAGEIRPAVADPGLNFRLLIAAHLCSVVASEVDLEDGHDRGELERLVALLGGTADLPPTGAERRALFIDLNRRLSEAIRNDAVDGENVEAHLVATLRDKLQVINPRFALDEAIEPEAS